MSNKLSTITIPDNCYAVILDAVQSGDRRQVRIQTHAPGCFLGTIGIDRGGSSGRKHVDQFNNAGHARPSPDTCQDDVPRDRLQNPLDDRPAGTERLGNGGGPRGPAPSSRTSDRQSTLSTYCETWGAISL